MDLPCPDEQGLYAKLTKLADREPKTALHCAAPLKTPEQRDGVLRIAFPLLARQDPEAAKEYLDQVIDRPWVGVIGLRNAARIAPDNEKLLLAAALYNPSVALRDLRDYIDLPLGPKIFTAVVRAVPGEAVAIAAGNSVTGLRIREAMAAGDADLKALHDLAADPGIDLPLKSRVALLVPDLPRDRALMAARDDAAYFRALASMPSREQAARHFAEMTFYEMRNGAAASKRAILASFDTAELFLFMTLGRAEANAQIFDTVFDQLLAPRWKGLDIKPENLRPFLTTALAFGRLQKFLNLPGNGKATVLRSLENLRTIEDAISAGEIVDRITEPALAAAVGEALRANYTQASGSSVALYGILAARFSDKAPVQAGMKEIAARYRKWLQPPRTFESSVLFDRQGRCFQRYFFYNDNDGVESYEVFRRTYRGSPNWRFTEHGEYARVSGKGPRGRSIEIYTNIPLDLTRAENRARTDEVEARQQTVTKLLSNRGIQPSVVVHRGHSYHLYRTLRSLTEDVRLVYLGSCRGMGNVDTVLHNATRAQMFATYGTGSHTINDPLLKAINEELLNTPGKIDWEQFWSRQRARLGRNPLFAEYLPPHRNTAAILLNAYYRYLAGAE